MCKVHSLVYACGHSINITLSRCLGHFAKCNQKSCRGNPALYIHASSYCGQCIHQQKAMELDQECDEAADNVDRLLEKLDRSGPQTLDWLETHAERSEAWEHMNVLQDSLEAKLVCLKREFPAKRGGASEAEEWRGPAAQRTGSLLRCEIKVEDLVGEERLRKKGWLSRMLRPTR